MQDTDSLGQMAKLAGFLPYLEEAIGKIEAALEARVYAALDKGELSPEQALLYWQQKLTYRRLLRHFDQRVRVAESIGHRVGQQIGSIDIGV